MDTLDSHTGPAGGSLDGLIRFSGGGGGGAAQDSTQVAPERLMEDGSIPVGAVWGSGKGPLPLTQMPGPVC